MSREKQIEEMAVDLCLIDRCKHLPQAECHNTTCAHCEAEALYNAGYRKQEWISVDERLPDGNGKFLIADEEGYITTASWYRDYGWFMHVCNGTPVTHWMPLPEAPKMKGGAE